MAPPPGGDPKDPPPIPPKSPVPPADRLKPIPRSSRTSGSTSPTVVPASAAVRLEGPVKVTEPTYSGGNAVKTEDVDVFEDTSDPRGYRPPINDVPPEDGNDNSEDGLMLLPPYNPGKSKPPPLEPPKPTVAGIKAKLAGLPRRKQTGEVIAREAEKVLKHITEREAPKSTPPKSERSQPVPELDATGAFAISKPSQPPPAPEPPPELRSVTPAPDREAKPRPKAVPKKPVIEPMYQSLSQFAGEILWLALTVLAVMVRGLGFAVIQLADFWARLPRPEQLVIQMPRAEMVRMIEAIVEQKLRERQDKLIVLPMVLPELQLPSLAAPPPAAPAQEEILEALADEDGFPGPSLDDWATPPDAPELEDVPAEARFVPETLKLVALTPAETQARREKFTAVAILVVAVLIPVIFWVIVGQFGGITALLHGHTNPSTQASTPQSAAGDTP